MLLKAGGLAGLWLMGIFVKRFRINEIKRPDATATCGVFAVKRWIATVKKLHFYGIAFAGRE
jgi:hypothetical protein